MDFSPRSTSPMNLPDSAERSPRASWLQPRSLRSERILVPSALRTWFTRRSISDGLRWSGRHGEDQRSRLALDAVDTARRTPGVVACSAHTSVVRHAALEDPDLLGAEMAVARDDRARLVAHEDGLVAVPALPQHLPEDAPMPLDPRDVGRVDVARRGGQ